MKFRKDTEEFDLTKYLESRLGEASELYKTLEEKGKGKGEEMKLAVGFKLRKLESEYKWDQIKFFKKNHKHVRESYYTPQPHELKRLKNAITREAANQLLTHIEDNYELPVFTGLQEQSLSKHRETAAMFENATRRIGIPLVPKSGSEVDRLLPKECKRALDNWHAKKLEELAEKRSVNVSRRQTDKE